MMASNHGNPAELQDYWNEFDDIESSKDPDEYEELSKTPDEGEMEAAWLHQAGYGFVASKLQEGRDLSEDELEGLTSSLPRHQAAAVRKRIDILSTTMRKKQKQGKMHVKDIFSNQEYQRQPSSPTNYPPLSPDIRPIRRESAKNRDRGAFLKRGGYSMSGAYTAEVEHYTNVDTIHGVQVLSINPRSTQNWRPSNHKGHRDLGPITDSEISVEFHLEERDNQENKLDPRRVDLPGFNMKPDPLGVTCTNDLSQSDLVRIRSLALIELTALYDHHNISYSRPKKKKRIKEHGLFRVPIQILLEHDRKKFPSAKVPLIFQEMIRFLETEGLEVEGILRVPGAVSRVKQLRHELEEKFHNGTFSWQDVWPNDAAALMKQFIRDLPIPLLTYDYIDAFPQVKSIPTSLMQLKALNLLVLVLPDEHRDTLRVLLQFLRKVVAHSNDNKMGLSNVAMIMAPNLFLGPANRGKPGSIEQLELSKAHGTSDIVKMLIHYQDELWTVPPFFMKQLRYQTEADTQRKNRKSRFRGRKDKSDIYRKSAPESDLPDGVIRVQAPHLTKHSTRVQLDDRTTAGDVVSKFRRTAGSHADRRSDSFVVRSDHHGHVMHSMSFRNPDNAQFADANACLFEVGGNIGERRVDPRARMLDLLRENPHAEWVIKVHHR